MSPKSSRRKLISVLLLGAGLVGAAMRWYYPAPAAAHDMGTLLMVMWVPAVGNFIGYLLGRLPFGRRPPPGFSAGRPFTADARVALDFMAPTSAASLTNGIVLLVGEQAFSARCQAEGGPENAWTCELQFLVAEVARSHFAVGTTFHVLGGTSVVGSGRVLEWRGAAPAMATQGIPLAASASRPAVPVAKH